MASSERKDLEGVLAARRGQREGEPETKAVGERQQGSPAGPAGAEGQGENRSHRGAETRGPAYAEQHAQQGALATPRRG